MMIKETLIIRSSISAQFLKKILFGGFAIAFPGVLILLLPGIFMPQLTLQHWGWVFYLMGLGLITGGLLPYRRFSRLQLKPNELIVDDLNQIVYCSKGKKILTIQLQSVSKMSYVDHPRHYGILIWLKPMPIAPIVIHQSVKEAERLRLQGRQIGKADLFCLISINVVMMN